jgi:hypothetical protein
MNIFAASRAGNSINLQVFDPAAAKSFKKMVGLREAV